MEFLEILRYLNKNNIDNEQNLSDKLFKNLMIFSAETSLDIGS